MVSHFEVEYFLGEKNLVRTKGHQGPLGELITKS